MALHARFSKVLDDTEICHYGSCTNKPLYYADNDRTYCEEHVLKFIDLYRITTCTHCDCPDLQVGTDCKKCGGAL